VNFINNENLEAATGWEILDVLPELADILDTGIGSAVYLENVYGVSGCNLTARRTLVTRLRSWSQLTLECLGENAGGTCLPYSTGTGKQEGMGNPA